MCIRDSSFSIGNSQSSSTYLDRSDVATINTMIFYDHRRGWSLKGEDTGTTLVHLNDCELTDSISSIAHFPCEIEDGMVFQVGDYFKPALFIAHLEPYEDENRSLVSVISRGSSDLLIMDDSEWLKEDFPQILLFL
eukprot:TRINITY_DN10379_c0_g1_i1.p1 TRINITY_DN10379_c0_g1~~TRINITY_DN10379_c0_g1_i1.p1  ORF type:complete len:152 (+),score=12.57 TRINITY_DN10379_c0_g1_i1:51-458(+)